MSKEVIPLMIVTKGKVKNFNKHKFMFAVQIYSYFILTVGFPKHALN